MTKDNDWYLKALHWGNEGHRAWASSEHRGRSKVLTHRCFQQKKGDKPWNFNRLIKRQTAPLPSLENGQVTKSNRTYTLREFPERFAKKIGWGCMNYHLFQKDSQSVFSKKKKLIKSKSKSQNRERMSWTLYNFPLHCIVSYEVSIIKSHDKGCMRLHP